MPALSSLGPLGGWEGGPTEEMATFFLTHSIQLPGPFQAPGPSPEKMRVPKRREMEFIPMLTVTPGGLWASTQK